MLTYEQPNFTFEIAVDYTKGPLRNLRTCVMSKKNLNKQKIENIASFILDNLETELSVSRLAEMTGMSESVFRHEFKHYHKISVYAYILEMRMQRAAGLFKLGGLTASQISAAVGYHNLSSFCRAFKRRFGISPANFQSSLTDNYTQNPEHQI